MMRDLRKFLSEEQQFEVVECLMGKVNELLNVGEVIEYVGIQKRITKKPFFDYIAITNKRIIFVISNSLELSNVQCYTWEDILECHMAEVLWSYILFKNEVSMG